MAMKGDKIFSLFVIFFVAVSLLLTITAKNLTFLANDTHEMIVVAKAFAGFYNLPVFHLHTVVYMLAGSLTFFFSESLLPFRIITTLLLLSSGYLIYWLSKDKKAFLLWALSPIPWMSFGSIEPIIPSSILIFLAYLFYKRYERTNGKWALFASGTALGLSSAVYEGAWPLIPVFLLVYFWGRKGSEIVFFLSFFVLGFSTKIFLDFMLFGSAFATTARMLGINLVLFLGMGKTANIKELNLLHILYQLILISPVQILIYRQFSKDKRDFLFITLSFLVFVLLFMPNIRYIYMIAPTYLYLLSKVITKKSLVIHAVISIPIILFFIFFSLTPVNNEIAMFNDLKDIKADFPSKFYVVDKTYELVLAAGSWDATQFLWLSDYTLPERGQTLNEYVIEENSADYLWKRLYFKVGFLSNREQEYDKGYPIIMHNSSILDFKGYALRKCYREMCVYTTV